MLYINLASYKKHISPVLLKEIFSLLLHYWYDEILPPVLFCS